MEKYGLTDPVEGFEECADKREEEAGEEPAHHLRIDVVLLAGLPVGIDAQPAEYPGNGTDDQHQIGERKIPAVHLARGEVELIDARLGLAHDGHQGQEQAGRPACWWTRRAVMHRIFPRYIR